MLPTPLRRRVADLIDDPRIAGWALDRLGDLERCGLAEERAELLEGWFGDDRKLERLFDAAGPSVLPSLLATLPPERLAPLAERLARAWPGWRGRLAERGARALAAGAPETAARLFRERLEGASARPSPDERFVALGILANLSRLPQEAATESRELALALAPPPEEGFDPALFRLLGPRAAAGEPPGLPAMLQAARPDRLADYIERFAEILLGHAAFFALAADTSAGRWPGGFQGVAALFASGAPLAALDAALLAEPRAALPDLMVRLENLGSLAADTLLAGMGPESWPGLPEASLAPLRDLAVATLAEPWRRPPEELQGLELETLLDLAALPLLRGPWHDAVAEGLRRHPPEVVASELTRRFLLGLEGATEGLLRLLETAGALARPEVVPLLLEATSDSADDALCETAAHALARIGAPAVAAIVERWDELDASQRIYAFSVFEIVANEDVRDFLLERADELLQEDPELFASAATCVPDSRFVSRLASRIAAAGASEIEAFYVLCRLLDESPPELAALAEHFERARAREAELPDLIERLERELWLLLRCPECGAVAEYRVGRVFLDPERSDASPYVADEIPCRSCGALVDLEPTQSAREAIQGAALRQAFRAPSLAARPGDESDDGREDESGAGPDDASGDEGPIYFTPIRLADGRVVPLAEAVAGYRRLLAEDGANAEPALALANTYRTIERNASAERLYRRALELDPTLVEAAWGLAHIHLDDERPRDAFRVLGSALEHAARWRFLRLGGLTPGEARAEIARQYEDLRDYLGAREAPPAPASLTATLGRKVARNAPCPCGSGKKYKKCCGARR